MYRQYNCNEALMRHPQSVDMAQPCELLPANVAKGVNVDVIVFCDGTPQMKCTAKLGSKAFSHSVSTWYLYSVPPMLRKALRKLQQCRWGYGFEVVKDPSSGEVKFVHLTYHTKPPGAIKEEPATLRLTTYTNPDDGASAVMEYARDFKASKKRKLNMVSGSKTMPSGTRIRLSGGPLHYAEHDYSSPLGSQSGSPTSPYGTRSPSISSDCTQASDRLALPAMPIPNLSGSNNPHAPESAWDMKDERESLMTSTAMETGHLRQTSSVMHTSSLTDHQDGSRGHMSVNCSAQPTPSSMAQFDDGYTSQASSHNTPAPSPLTVSNQQAVQIQGGRIDASRYMGPPQRGLLSGGHHRLFGGVYEHLSSNSSSTVLPKSADTAVSPGSAECSDDDVDPGMYCNRSFANSNYGNNTNTQAGGESNRPGNSTGKGNGNGMALNIATSMPGPTPVNGTVNGPMNGTVSGAMNGTMNGLMNGTGNGPMNGTINGAMNAMVSGPMNAMVSGPMTGSLNGLSNGPANAHCNGPRKLQTGSTMFNFKPQTQPKSYDPDATVHSMFLPKEPSLMPSCGARLPNLRPVHVPSFPVVSGTTTSLDGWHSQAAAASATPTPNSNMAIPAQLPNLFDVPSSAPDVFDSMGNLSRAQGPGQLLPLPDLWDWNARLAMASPGALLGPLSVGHLNMWGDEFANECGVRSDNFHPNMDLDSLLNTSNWGQTGSAVL